MIKKISMILLILILFTVAAFGQQDAHEHGAGDLQIILENDRLELIVLISGVDFIGFEHLDVNEAEEKLIYNKMKELESNGEDLIRFNTAWWMKVVPEIRNVGKKSDDEHDLDDSHRSEHREYELYFSYSMEDSRKLKGIELKEFFRYFSSLSEIRWIMLTPGGQSAGKAEKTRTYISINE